MNDNFAPDTRTSTDRLHPLVWITLIGFIVWFVVALWGFGIGGYVDWLLVVVSGFILMAVLLPLTLSRVWRHTHEDEARNRTSFRDWATGEFQTWQDRAKGTNAAVEIIMPIAAAAIGMTAFAIIFHYAAAHAPAAAAFAPVVAHATS